MCVWVCVNGKGLSVLRTVIHSIQQGKGVGGVIYEIDDGREANGTWCLWVLDGGIRSVIVP